MADLRVRDAYGGKCMYCFMKGSQTASEAGWDKVRYVFKAARPGIDGKFHFSFHACDAQWVAISEGPLPNGNQGQGSYVWDVGQLSSAVIC